MRKLIRIVFCAGLVLCICSSVEAKKGGSNKICTSIQEGIIFNSSGDLITTGYDMWGYNYQARIFNGYYCDALFDDPSCQDYKDDRLIMKWNDAWLSNKDCDGDGFLDRHFGSTSYLGSGAWLTNHMSGEYTDVDGNVCKWSQFAKIVAVPDDAQLESDTWFAADGTVIGPVIWGQFAIVLFINNDPCAGAKGVEIRSPDGPGLGKYK